MGAEGFLFSTRLWSHYIGDGFVVKVGTRKVIEELLLKDHIDQLDIQRVTNFGISGIRYLVKDLIVNISKRRKWIKMPSLVEDKVHILIVEDDLNG
ncbi:MAG: hypothetical protein R2867_37845 [Caldilineaceae bacterium]